jgi:hypothetical protein
MPPFVGTEQELQELAAYLGSLVFDVEPRLAMRGGE